MRKAFAIRWCNQQYPMILLADSERPDQSAHPHELIRAFALRIFLDSITSMARNTDGSFTVDDSNSFSVPTKFFQQLKKTNI